MIPASPDVDTILTVMRSLSLGEVLSYTSLSKLLGRKVTAQSSALRTARKRALRDADMVFEAVPNIGYKRLDANGAVRVAGEGIRSVRRKARHGIRVIDTTRGSNLPLNTRALADGHFLRYRLISEIADPKTGRSVQTAEVTVSPDDIVKAVAATLGNLLKKDQDPH